MTTTHRPIARILAALALVGALAACNPQQQAQNQPQPYGPQQPGANGWPTGPQQPQQPGWPGQPGQPGMPGAMPGMNQPGMPGQPGMNPTMPTNAPGPMTGQAPAGMQAVPSQAGAVFATGLQGGPASQLSQMLYQRVAPFFDRPPQVMGAMNDASDMFGQVGFQATLQGQPVMGMIVVTANGQGGAKGYLLFDRAERFGQSGPAMMNVVQQHAGSNGGGW